MKKFLILLLLVVSFLFATTPTRFDEVRIRENLTVDGTSTLTGTVSAVNLSASGYLAVTGTETLTSANTAVSVVLGETIITFTDSVATTENYTLALPASGAEMFKVILTSAANVTPSAIVPVNLSNGTTINLYTGDTVQLKFSTPNWYVIGGDGNSQI